MRKKIKAFQDTQPKFRLSWVSYLKTKHSPNALTTRFSLYKKPPLCKGRWIAKQDGGIVLFVRIASRTIPQSPYGDSSLYTREPCSTVLSSVLG